MGQPPLLVGHRWCCVRCWCRLRKLLVVAVGRLPYFFLFLFFPSFRFLPHYCCRSFDLSTHLSLHSSHLSITSWVWKASGQDKAGQGRARHRAKSVTHGFPLRTGLDRLLLGWLPFISFISFFPSFLFFETLLLSMRLPFLSFGARFLVPLWSSLPSQLFVLGYGASTGLGQERRT